MVSMHLISRQPRPSYQMESSTCIRRTSARASECRARPRRQPTEFPRYMPPTGPFGSLPRVAVVFARLVVQGEDRGVRPFLVALGDGHQMCKGVTSRCAVQTNVKIQIFDLTAPSDWYRSEVVSSLLITP